MGRKAISGEPKGYRLQIRLTEAERAILERAAGRGKVSAWARDILLRAARKAKG